MLSKRDEVPMNDQGYGTGSDEVIMSAFDFHNINTSSQLTNV